MGVLEVNLYQASTYVYCVFSAILSSVFINWSLPAYYKLITSTGTTSDFVATSILVDEISSIIVNIFSFMILDRFPIYALTMIGFSITCIAYFLFIMVIKIGKLSSPLRIHLTFITRGIYAIGNSLSLSLIFSSINHVFKDSDKARGVGGSIYGFFSVLAAVTGSLVIPRISNIMTSYWILAGSQLLSVVLFLTGIRCKNGISFTKFKEPSEHLGVFKKVRYTSKYLMKRSLNDWIAIFAIFAYGWLARTMSIAPYTVAQLSLSPSIYSSFVGSVGMSQVFSALFYIVSIGGISSYCIRNKWKVQLVYVMIFGILPGFLAYAFLSFNVLSSYIPVWVSGALAGCAQVTVVFYQMSFVSAIINSQVKEASTGLDISLDQKETKSIVRPFFVFCASLFGSLGNIVLTQLSREILFTPEESVSSTTNKPETTSISQEEFPTTRKSDSIGLAISSTSITTTTTTSPINNKPGFIASYLVIIIPSVFAAIFDINYHKNYRCSTSDAGNRSDEGSDRVGEAFRVGGDDGGGGGDGDGEPSQV